ncbi:MAG: NADPH-dependent FMN reductase [Proteobacteria bacterium]|nr:MAG: NADPH-dependent FMN reductase [Pseudomonadota bacterium]
MTSRPHVLVFAGSTRDASPNRQLARGVVTALGALDAQATLLELSEYPLPLYDHDLQATRGIPRNAMVVRAQLQRHPTWLIVSPEHNGSLPALLKNVIDWACCPVSGQAPLGCFKDKTVALLSATGARHGLLHLRHILEHLGARVLDREFVLEEPVAFDPAGLPRDAELRARLEAYLAEVLDTAAEREPQAPWAWRSLRHKARPPFPASPG